MSFIKVRDVHYHVHIEGEGTPLLLLHGFTGSHENWLFHADYLRDKGYQLIIPDILGHGMTDSPQDSSRYQMQQISNDIHILLDILKIKRCHLIGYSMGGRLALYLARHYPQYFERIVLESASAGLATQGGRIARKRKDDMLADFIAYAGIDKFITYWETLPMWQTHQSMGSEIRDLLHAQRIKNDPIGLANNLRGMGTGVQPSLWDELNFIKHPILLITGEKDHKFTYVNEFMARLLPDAHHYIVKNSGHSVNLERGTLFWEKTFGFLETN